MMLDCAANSNSVRGEDKPGLASDLFTLTKVGLTSLVLVTTSVGFYMASADFDAGLFAATLLGTALLAGGGQALNQVIEAEQDALMERTKNRPVPQGRIGRNRAMGLGSGMALTGASVLGSLVNYQSAMLGVLTLVIYLGLYTPLKRFSPVCTMIGAVAGAIPPVLGWVAVNSDLTIPAGLLFGILFFWQIPHFLAIAWLYREDYLRAGLRVLPSSDGSGIRTGMVSFGASIALTMVTLSPFNPKSSGLCEIGIGICGLGMLACALRFLMKRNRSNARGLFLCSIVYLPLVLLFVMWA